MAAKLARMRGGSAMKDCGPKGYATGGAVSGDIGGDDDSNPIDGVSAKKSMSKPGRMKGKGDKDKKIGKSTKSGKGKVKAKTTKAAGQKGKK